MIDSFDLDTRRDQMRRMVAKMIGQRCYIVFASEIGLECHGRLGGFTAVGLHTLIKETMPGEYVGPLPTVVVVDNDLRDVTLSPAAAACMFDAICLHELAHIVERGINAENGTAIDAAILRGIVATPWTEWPLHSPAKWAGHDLKYIRVLCHLLHRSKSRGLWVSPELAFGHEDYGLSPLSEYADSLGDEPQLTSWLPLSQALNRPAPDEFKQLWSRDVVASLMVGNALERGTR